jgi:tetratricopeptide (TPR) repeat protein
MKKCFINIISILFIIFIATNCFGQSEAEKLNVQGNDLGRQGKYEEAIKKYDKAIQNDPAYSEPYYNRGKAKLNLKDYKGAIVDFNSAINLDPKNSDIYNNRGIAKKKIKDLKGAIEDYNKSLTLDKTNYRVYLNRGIAKFENGDENGACSVLKFAKEHKIEGAESGLKQIGCN